VLKASTHTKSEEIDRHRHEACHEIWSIAKREMTRDNQRIK